MKRPWAKPPDIGRKALGERGRGRRTGSPSSSLNMRRLKRTAPPEMALTGDVVAKRLPGPSKHRALPETELHRSVATPPEIWKTAAARPSLSDAPGARGPPPRGKDGRRGGHRQARSPLANTRGAPKMGPSSRGVIA